MTVQELSVFPDVDALSEAAAQYVAHVAGQAIEERDGFSLALAGGSTPRRLYQLLAGPVWRNQIDWERWHFSWVTNDSYHQRIRIAIFT